MRHGRISAFCCCWSTMLHTSRSVMPSGLRS